MEIGPLGVRTLDSRCLQATRKADIDRKSFMETNLLGHATQNRAIHCHVGWVEVFNAELSVRGKGMSVENMLGCLEITDEVNLTPLVVIKPLGLDPAKKMFLDNR